MRWRQPHLFALALPHVCGEPAGFVFAGVGSAPRSPAVACRAPAVSLPRALKPAGRGLVPEAPV